MHHATMAALAAATADLEPEAGGGIFAGALCAQADPEKWFPGHGGTVRSVRAICGRCPAQDECREYAVARPDVTGIWGGTTSREREQIRAARHRRSVAA